VRGRDADARAIAAGSLRTNLMARLGVVRQIASTLVLLGLIGTVIGFIMSLGGIKPEVASDPSAVAEMISTLIQGMSVALYTTLVGAVLNIWLTVNFSILHTGTQRLLSRIVDRGEAEAGR